MSRSLEMGGLARDAEDAVLDVDLNVLLRQSWQLKRRRHEVLVLVLVEVHSVALVSILARYVNREWRESTHLGRMGREAAFVLSLWVRADDPPEDPVRAANASSKRRSKSARE